MRAALVAAFASLSFIGGVSADDTKPDKSGYSLLNPTPDDLLRELSSDRPTKSAGPITVDAGRIQIESDFANYTTSNVAGVKTRTFQTLDPVLKLGVTNWADVELQLNGFQSTVMGDGMGSVTRSRGFGDVFLRSKINFIGNDGGDVAFAAIPYVKLPSRLELVSNGVVEAGIVLPLQLKLPFDFALTLMTEFDALKNANDSRRHANFVNLINLSHEVPGIKGLTAYAEFYSSISAEKASPDMYTADFAVSYLVSKQMQLDAGINFGLNRDAPKLQAYSGVSYRF